MQRVRGQHRTLAGDLAAVIGYLNRLAAPEMFAVVAELELSLSQIKALHMIDATGEQALGELASGLHLSPGAASRAVDGLHRLGLVTRSEDSTDRRVRRLALTQDGAQLVAQMAAARMSALEELTGSLDRAERDQLAAALAPLLARAEIAGCRPAEADR
jgi:DNA-binding MarR family transcriptional regulator